MAGNSISTVIFSGELAALLTALCWSFNSLAFSLAGKRVGSPVVNHVRLWIALFAVMVIHLIARGTLFPTGEPTYRYVWLGLSGLVGFALGDAALFESLVLIGPRRAMTIMATNPIIGALLSWIILGEDLNAMQIGAIALTIGAVMWVVSEPHGEDRAVIPGKAGAGYLFAAIGSLCQAAGMLLSKMGMSGGGGFSPISANYIRITVGLAAMFIFTAFRGELPRHVKALRDVKASLYILVGAILGPVVGVMLALYAISMTKIGIATTLTSLSPIILIPVSYFAFGEKVTARAVIGTVAAIAGASLLFLL